MPFCDTVAENIMSIKLRGYDLVIAKSNSYVQIYDKPTTPEPWTLKPERLLT